MNVDLSRVGFDLVGEIVRVFKVRRLYDRTHPQRAETERAALAKIDRMLEAHGPVDLDILEDRLLWNDEVVYQHDPGIDSLAFLLYREGLRSLSVYPGLTEEELTVFLEHVAASTKPGYESELLARLWEEHLIHLRYEYVESLADQEWVPQLPEDGDPSTQEPGAKVIDLDPADRLDPDDLPLIRESEANVYQLDDEDMSYLRNMFEAEERAGLFEPVLTCLRELLLAEPHDDAGPIVAAIRRLQAWRLRHGDFGAVRQIHEILDPCLERSGALVEAFRDLRKDALVDAALGQMAARLKEGSIQQADVIAYYRSFGEGNLSALLAGVSDLKRLCQDPMFVEMFVELANGEPDALRTALRDDSAETASNAAYLAGIIADPRHVDALGEAAGRPETIVRREALLALKQFDLPRATDHIARRIGDREPSIRLYALRHVIAHRYVTAFESTIAPAVEGDQLEERSSIERRLWYEAYGVLGGQRVIERLRNQLFERGGLFRRVDPESISCAAIALAAGGTSAGRQTLEEARRASNAVLRHAAEEALRSFSIEPRVEAR